MSRKASSAYRKVTYRSRIGDLDIPAYLFQPLEKRGPKGHAAMVWVHGGVHGDWDITMWPFVKEAVERGYVMICPEYRGSTGYGESLHNEIDYGGYEIDDVLSAVDYLEDAAARGPGSPGHHGLEPRRLHHAVLGVPRRDAVQGRGGDRAGDEPGLPPSYKGPSYQRDFATQQRIQGLPFEKPRGVHQAFAALPRGQAEDAASGARGDQRYGRELRRGSADGGRAAVAQAGPRRDEDLRRSAAVGREAATRSAAASIPRRSSGRFARADRFVESTWVFFEWHLRPSEDKSKSLMREP